MLEVTCWRLTFFTLVTLFDAVACLKLRICRFRSKFLKSDEPIREERTSYSHHGGALLQLRNIGAGPLQHMIRRRDAKRRNHRIHA